MLPISAPSALIGNIPFFMPHARRGCLARLGKDALGTVGFVGKPAVTVFTRDHGTSDDSKVVVSTGRSVMKTRQFGIVAGVLSIIFLVSSANAQEEILVDSKGGVELWSIPQANPADGVLATILELRTTDPDARVVTFTNFKLEGNVHQSWLEGPFGLTGTAHVGLTEPGATYDASWGVFDSHLLITPDMVGGGAGGGFPGITETNDGSTTELIGATLPKVSNFGASTGFGGIAMGLDTDAFFLNPENQSNVRPWAYVVTDEATAAAGEVMLTLGVLGDRVIDAGAEGGAAFGYDTPISVPFVPEPSSAALLGLASLGLLGLRKRA